MKPTPITHIETISEMYHLLPKATIKHPLIAIVDFSHYKEQFYSGMKITLGFYAIMCKNSCINRIKYGQESYDFQEGSLVCIAPRQLISLDEQGSSTDEIGGWGIFFHPDLLKGTTLASKMKEYSFFGYETHEALHLSPKEREMLQLVVHQLHDELIENIDKHTQQLIVSHLELLLNYCRRYYDRQFITRKSINLGLIAQIEEVLTRYFHSDKLAKEGLPTVKYLADQMSLSSSYLSDLLKRETGMNAQERIHYYLIEEAKIRLLGSTQTVGELAFALGFDYPQYFSRLFKSKTGMTPQQYRKVN